MTGNFLNRTMVTAAVLCLGASGVHAASMKQAFIGCRDPEVLDKIDMAAGGGDRKVFDELYAAAMATGECVGLRQGEKVFIDDTQSWPPIFCVRPERLDRCYWTEVFAVDR